MSATNPGGSRKVGGRVFGAATISRACKSMKTIPGIDAPNTSIADQPHANNREAERRARQQAAREAKAARRSK